MKRFSLYLMGVCVCVENGREKKSQCNKKMQFKMNLMPKVFRSGFVFFLYSPIFFIAPIKSIKR